MKTIALFAAVAVSLLAVSAADAQSDSTTTRTARKAKRTTVITTRDNAAVTRRLRRIEADSRITTPVPRGSRIDGSVTRSVRSRNPLQMVNPFAPKEYGDGTGVTFHEPDDAFQRPEGLKLFAVEF